MVAHQKKLRRSKLTEPDFVSVAIRICLIIALVLVEVYLLMRIN